MKRLTFLLVSTLSSHAATMQTSVGFTGGEIPDGSATGISASTTLTEPSRKISKITVELGISGVGGDDTFLGDLYIYLTDGTNLVTLLNRPGRSAAMPDGYDDTFGMNVTFTDEALIDAHQYRPAISGGNANPLTSELTGLLQPDGRNTSPTFVVTGDARTTSFSDFNGLSADRTLTLFAADLSGGSAHQIDSWSLEITTIPEPSTLILTSAAAGLGLRRRRRWAVRDAHD